MKIEEFKKIVIEIKNEEAESVRKNFIRQFIDNSKEYFNKYILEKKLFSDGYCYTGYLWDCLIEPKVVNLEYFFDFVSTIDSVFVMWDIHSKDRIFIKDYWKFGKQSILQTSLQDVLSNLEHLPEDIYIFDQSFSWVFVITHEEVEGERWCLEVTN